MPNVTRAMIPEEFFDWTDTKLLVQPEPQYVFADLILKSLGASLTLPGAVGLPGRTLSGQGAAYSNAESDRLMIEPDTISSNVFATKIDFKGQSGNTVRVNRPKYTDSTYTLASRRIPSGTTISTTGIKVDSEQAVLTLNRYGGPYSSEVQPFVIEAFDVQMGVHNLIDVVGKHLVRDFHKFLDTVGVDLLMNGANTNYPKGMTAANDATAAGQFPLDYETLSRTHRLMDDAYLPKLPDGRRVIVVTPTGLQQMKNDKQFALYAHDYPEKSPLFEKYANLKYVLPEWYVFSSSTLDVTANTSSVNIHTALAIAPGALGLGMGRAPHVAFNTNDNYGESVPLIWLADLAFELLDNRFCRLVKYTAEE